MIYQFDNFQLDQQAKKLFLKGKVISYDEKMLTALGLLCEAYPEMVDKEYLTEKIWPEQIVTDWSISRVISDLRHLLGDSGKDQGYIKTIRGRGFCFNTPVIKIDEKDPDKGAQKNNSLHKTGVNHRIKRKLAVIVFSIVAIAVIVFWPQKEKKTNFSQARVAVLPVVTNNDDPSNAWIKYGVMSLVSEQLQRYKSLQVLPVTTVIKSLSSGTNPQFKQALSQQQFEQICFQLGCSHLIQIKYHTLDEQPVFTYQIALDGYQSPISEFSQTDTMSTVDMLIERLSSALIPGKVNRISLKNTYSKDDKANRDYAIGIHELLSGEIKAARTYLTLAVDRDADFFWAKAYLAEVSYRGGHLTEALEQYKKLLEAKLTDHQKWYLRHLYSNILYSQGKYQQSLKVSLELLKSEFVKNNPLRMANELVNIGSSYQVLGKLNDAGIYLKRSQQKYQLAHYGPGAGKALFNLGNVYVSMKDYKKAKQYYQQSKEIFKKYSMSGYELMARHQLISTDMELGNTKNVENKLIKLIQEYRKIGDLEGEYASKADLVGLSFLKKDYHLAIQRAEELLSQLKETKFAYWQNITIANLVRSKLALGKLKEAEQLFQKIKEIWIDIRPEYSLLEAQLHFAKKDIRGAIALANKVKIKLGSSWSENHQQVLNTFEEALPR
ncbi:MAG TPA: tetratricopeptide repeat protein [Aeromonadales bacterium]|nr:tetratricopeptide repeat protein [Aeromonadales bacterium]